MKSRTAQIALFLTLILVAASVYLSFASYYSRSIRDHKILNTVFLVTSQKKNSNRLDLLFLANYFPKEGYLNLIPIPTDTLIHGPDGKSITIGKIFEASFKKQKNIFIASSEVKKTVEELFLNKVIIPYYAAEDRAILERIIDLSGGVPVDLEEPITKKTGPGVFTVLVSSGRQNLTGQNAFEYLAFKSDYQESATAVRNQIFPKSFFGKFSNPFFLLKSPQIVSLFVKNIKSNLNTWDYLFASFELKDVKLSNIHTYQFPGSFKRGRFEPDRVDIEGLMNKLFPPSGTYVSEGPKVRLEVWNASGRNNLAEKVTWIMRAKGFDVVEWGTYSVRQKKTLIKDMSGDSKNAQLVAKTVACGEIVTRYDAKRYVDISLILGEDCKLE